MPEAVDRLRRLGGTQVVAKIDVDGVALHAAGDLVRQMGKALGQVGRALDGVVLHTIYDKAKHPSQTQL